MITYVARAPLLRGLAAPLIINESLENADGIVMANGDRIYSEVARFHEGHPQCEILVFRHAAGRLVRLHILPSSVDLAFEQLRNRGIGADRITVLPVADDDDRPLRTLESWLQNHPRVRLIVLSNAFSSRELRWRLDRRLPAEMSRRLFVRALDSQSFNQSEWWRSKLGVSSFVRCWLGLVLPLLQPDSQLKWHECNPEQFQPA
jgi:hypothetical protein